MSYPTVDKMDQPKVDYPDIDSQIGKNGISLLYTAQKSELREVKGIQESFAAAGVFSIVQYETEGKGVMQAQVNDFAWVLLHSNPTMQVADRSFIFANNDDPTNFFMLVLDDNTPTAEVEQLVDLLAGITHFEDHRSQVAAEIVLDAEEMPEAKVESHDKLVESIRSGTAQITQLIALSASTATALLSKYGERARSATPAVRGDQARKVTPALSKSVSTARIVTAKGAQVAGLAAGLVAGVAGKIAGQVISKAGSTESGKKLSRQGVIARESVRGGIEVYEAMEEAAKVVIASLSKEGTQYVQHKYGAEIGRVAEESFESGKNAWDTFRHMRAVGFKAVAKGIAKEGARNYASHAPSTRSMPTGDNAKEDAPSGMQDQGKGIRESMLNSINSLKLNQAKQ